MNITLNDITEVIKGFTSSNGRGPTKEEIHQTLASRKRVPVSEADVDDALIDAIRMGYVINNNGEFALP